MGAHSSPRPKSPGTAAAKQCKYLGSPVTQWKMKAMTFTASVCVCDREREHCISMCVSVCTIHIPVCVYLGFINAFRFLWTEASSTYLQVFVWKPRFVFFFFTYSGRARTLTGGRKPLSFWCGSRGIQGTTLITARGKKSSPLNINTILQKQSTDTDTHFKAECTNRQPFAVSISSCSAFIFSF